MSPQDGQGELYQVLSRCPGCGDVLWGVGLDKSASAEKELCEFPEINLFLVSLLDSQLLVSIAVQRPEVFFSSLAKMKNWAGSSGEEESIYLS